MKLFDSELKVMRVLWREGELTAKQISDICLEEIGWNMNTTYTVIKKCVAKGAIERSEPHFLCRALVTKEEIQKAETNDLVNRIFDGSEELLVASLLSGRRLSEAKRNELKRLIDETTE